MSVTRAEMSVAAENARMRVTLARRQGREPALEDRVLLSFLESSYFPVTTPRAEVRLCALLMEERLREKDGERATSWKHMGPKEVCVNLLVQAMRCDEARQAGDTALIRKHAVDTANFAMILLDVTGREVAPKGQAGAVAK